MARQIPLDLRVPPALAREDFLVTPDLAPALALIDRVADWPQGRLLLIGPEGSGKTHIAAFWAQAHGARCVPADALHPEAVDGLLAEDGALVVEDLHRAAGVKPVEEALFHLWNLAPMRHALLLLTARTPPRDWNLDLPDLRSRMDSVTQLRLGPPDDALLAAVLVKLFADRQLEVAPGLVTSLTRRMDRDLGLARRLVAAIDQGAMAAGRPVTRPLALDVLARIAAEHA